MRWERCTASSPWAWRPRVNISEFHAVNDLRPPHLDDAYFFGSDCQVLHAGNFSRVQFGFGTSHRLPAEVDRMGAERALVLSTPGRRAEADELAALLGKKAVGVCANAIMHSPVPVTDGVEQVARQSGADVLISLGGGSAIGLGKCVSLRTGLKHLTLPTTYSGSELTPIAGQTQAGVKVTCRDDRLRPSLIIYDPSLSFGVPATAAVASGMNAVAHAVEALYMSPDPIIGDVASLAIKHLLQSLPVIRSKPTDRAARSRALYGAWLAGFCLADTPMALHHKLCHTLGGAYDLPHAEMHAALLPHSLAFNAPAIPRAYVRLRHLFREFADDPCDAIICLNKALALPTSLAALGLPEEGIRKVARLAGQHAYANPRPLQTQAVNGLLRRAWAGAHPKIEGLFHA